METVDGQILPQRGHIGQLACKKVLLSIVNRERLMTLKYCFPNQNGRYQKD